MNAKSLIVAALAAVKPRLPLWIGLAAALALTLGGIVWASSSSTPETFTLEGELTLSSDGTFSMNPRCGGKDGYDDINQGAAVVVFDAAGKVLATSSLGEGLFADKPATLESPCVFKFAVPNVPSGEQFYQVQVSHRGKVPFDAAHAVAGTVSLSLG